MAPDVALTISAFNWKEPGSIGVLLNGAPPGEVNVIDGGAVMAMALKRPNPGATPSASKPMLSKPAACTSGSVSVRFSAMLAASAVMAVANSPKIRVDRGIQERMVRP